MDVVTLRLEPELVEELEAEADEKGFSNRTEYIRFILRNRSAYADENTAASGENTTEYDRLLEDLVERVEELEARLPDQEPTEQWGAGTPQPQSDTRPPEPAPAEESRHDPVTATESGDDDSLAEDVRAYIEDNDMPPKSEHGRDAVIEIFRELRQHGTMGVGDLQGEVYPGYEDHWAGPRAMWNAIDRYLEDIPGIEKGGYGEWAYSSDDNVRSVLNKLDTPRSTLTFKSE